MGSGRSEEQREQDAGLLLHLSKVGCRCIPPPEKPQQTPMQATACLRVPHIFWDRKLCMAAFDVPHPVGQPCCFEQVPGIPQDPHWINNRTLQL